MLLRFLSLVFIVIARCTLANESHGATEERLADRYFMGQLGLPITNPASENRAENSNLIFVETDTLRLCIDPTGGDVVALELVNDRVSPEDPSAVGLLGVEAGRNHCFLELKLVSDLENLSEKAQRRFSYVCAEKEYRMRDQEILTVSLEGERFLPDGQRVKVSKNFLFQKGSPIFQVEWQLENQSHQPLAFKAVSQFVLSVPASGDPSADFKSSVGLPDKIAFSTHAQKYVATRLSPERKSLSFKEYSDSGWIALVHQYFLCANCLLEAGEQTLYAQTDPRRSNLNVGSETPLQVIAPGEHQVIRTQFYCGPMQPDALESSAPYLSLTIDYGYASFLILPILKVATWLKALIGDWGLSILFLGFAVQMVLFGSFVYGNSRYFAKKALLQNRLESLKEKHSADPAGLMAAEQKFLRAHGVAASSFRSFAVNWIGAIFIIKPIFQATYALRLVSFAWLPDLTQPDPYSLLLPLFAALTVFSELMQGSLDKESASEETVAHALFSGLTFYFMKQSASGVVLYFIGAQVTALLQMFVLKQWFRVHPPVLTGPHHDTFRQVRK